MTAELSGLPAADQQPTRAGIPRPTNPYVPFTRAEVEQSIPARFESAVRQHPARRAVEGPSGTLTYDELDRAANRAAHALLATSDRGAEQVALLFGHDIGLVVGILGVLKAGKTYVPLDPAYPLRRTSYMLDDSRATLILTDDAHAPLAAELAGRERRVVNLDEIAVGASDRPRPTTSPDDLAYVLYTSGSTGRPKGVVQTHRNVLHGMLRYTNNLHLSASDRLILLASYTYSSSKTVIFGALLNGASIVTYDVKQRGIAELAAFLADQRITFYHSVPTLYRHFVETLTGRESFPDLRLLLFAGEPVTRRDVELYKRHFAPGCLFVNELGTSESMAFRFFYVDKQTEISGNLVPTGYRLEDTEVLLLDERGGPVEVGEVGEIALRSRYLTPGYWGKPDLTAAVFLPDPGGGPERIYRTGDLGRMRPDGCLEHLGRTDFQVKVDGHRIEVAEIELALLDHPRVKEAVVMAPEDHRGARRLVAYLVADSATAPPIGELRSFLLERLPRHMVPAAFVALDAMPLTPNGKLDRRALPAPTEARPDLERPIVPPRSTIEARLVEIWERVLGTKPIGVRDNFFELGGSSLLAARLAIEVRDTFGAEVTLSSFLVQPTIERLAVLMSGHATLTPWSPLVAMQTRGTRPPFFCVHGIIGDALTFFDLSRHLGPDQPLYGLRSPELDGVREPFGSIEAMADAYVDAIRTIQPVGPYYIGGYSFGGSVAFEMGHRLRAAGQEVGLLAILDHAPLTSSYHTLPRNPVSLVRLAKAFPAWLANFRTLGPFQRGLLRVQAGRLSRTLGKPKPPAERPPRWDLAAVPDHVRRQVTFQHELWSVSPSPEHHRRVWESQFEALMAYRPTVYPGRITLFRARCQPLFCSHDPLMGWSPLAIVGEVHVVPGDHFSMIAEPHVRVLARRLRACLDRAGVSG